MRTPVAAAASLALAGSLVLTGCSLLPGDDDGPEGSTTSAAPTELPSTSWRTAARSRVADGGTLRLAAGTLPATFNPWQADAANTDAATILAPTTGGAVRLTADGGWEVDPDYARSVEVVDRDPLTVRVRLNPDAVWQGGTAITADDMVAFWKAQNGSDDAYEVTSTAGYEDIEAVTPGRDRFTYTVRFSTPTAEWPLYVYPRLAANVSSSPRLFNRAFRSRAISSNGPFVVTSIDRRRGVIVQDRNPRWWGERPRLERITWNVATPELQAEAYAAGELDAVDVDATTYDAVKGVGTLRRAAGVEWSQVTLNGGRGPLEDVRVRRAVARAIDRDAIATTTSRALGAPPAPLGSLLLVPGQQGYRVSAGAIDHDPAAAARLLAKAGWTKQADGTVQRKGEPLVLTMPVPSGTPTNAQRARAIAKDLAEVGITVERRSVPAASFFDDHVLALDFDLVTFTRRASAFPVGAAEPLYYPIDSAQNVTGIGPRRLGTGFETVLGTLDDALRARRVAKLDEWLSDEASVVPLAVSPLVVAVRDGVVGYGASQFREPDWTRVGFLTKD